MFLRNPAERLLSAYLDKVHKKKGFSMKYNMTEAPSFDEFVHAISPNRAEFELGGESREKLRGVNWCKTAACCCFILFPYTSIY